MWPLKLLEERSNYSSRLFQLDFGEEQVRLFTCKESASSFGNRKICSGSAPRSLQEWRKMKVMDDERFIKDPDGTEDKSTISNSRVLQLVKFWASPLQVSTSMNNILLSITCVDTLKELEEGQSRQMGDLQRNSATKIWITQGKAYHVFELAEPRWDLDPRDGGEGTGCCWRRWCRRGRCIRGQGWSRYLSPHHK